MNFDLNIDMDDLGPYRVHSRREIVALLQNIEAHKQVVRMIFNDGADSIITSILQIDEAGDSLIIDCAPSHAQNQRIVESDNVAFETRLDRIRILFFANQVESCLFDDRPAFQLSLPDSVVRLQRREFYRVATPRCMIDIVHRTGSSAVTITVPVQNVSAGGLAIIDETKILNDTLGTIYPGCRIALPGGSSIVATLEVRNSQEISLASGKSVRRIGCLFVDLPMPMLTSVQRYITKLEREANTRSAGLE